MTFDPKREEGRPDDLRPPAAEAEAIWKSFGRTKALQDVSVSVPPSSPGGLLVLSDQWYPGWTATVDGKSVAILRGDLALRAVALSPGAHQVRFRYQPRWPLNGLAILAFTVAVGAVFAFGRRHNYHSEPVL